MIAFKAIDRNFPSKWQLGQTYAIKMFIFGFLPFGEVHYLHIDKINHQKNELSTKEWDRFAKIWNHNISMKKINEQKYTIQIKW